MPDADSQITWSWLPRTVAGATLVSMAVVVGMWIGGRDTGASGRLTGHDDRLTAQAARLDHLDQERNALERLTQDNAVAIAELIQRFVAFGDTRALIVYEAAKDREQLNKRVADLENDRITAAGMVRDFIGMRETDERQDKRLDEIVDRLQALERTP